VTFGGPPAHGDALYTPGLVDYLRSAMASQVEQGSSGVRVLGVDPGTRVTGFGILDLEPGKPPALVAHGAIRLPASPLAARLETLFRELREVIREHAPRVLAIERVFRGKSFESVLKVGEARGVAVLVAQMAGLEISEYAPAMIKKAATGNGNASKDQVQGMMARLLRMATAPVPQDAADALAAAFCHGQRIWRSKVAQATPDHRATRPIPGLSVAAARKEAQQLPRGLPRGSRAAQRLDLDALLRSGRARELPRASKSRARSRR